ncbi:MAG: phosphoribosylformylglycinamidine synthase [Candidatus Doudnabacteria bacterium]|nr:phosphoribosylformylglycinamidine synthase [Candidatus Doudnabacteria bacterium]
MPTRIDIKTLISDARGKVAQKNFENLGLKGKIKSVTIVDSYLVDKRMKLTDYKKAASVLTNPQVEHFHINTTNPPHKFDWVIEIGYLPGVTDNIGHTAKETIEDLLKKKFKRDEHVYASQLFFITGKLNEEEVKKIASSLYNPLIQRAEVKSYRQFVKNKGMGRKIPKVVLKPKKLVTQVNLDVNNEELAKIGKQGIANADGTRRGPLALDLFYMKAIQKHFEKLKRKPTDLELEALAQTWSEHCKHTIFANPVDEIQDGLFKTYIKRATEIIRKKKGKQDFCVSVFKDNSGAIIFDNKHLVTHKVETHNTPSALDPFGGAITGIVGVNRDTLGFGLGAKPVINTYGFCFGNPKDKRHLYKDPELKHMMLPPKRIMQGVIKGINVGGNCSGIPTALGFMQFDDRYRGKPLVFAGTVGLIPKKAGKLTLHEKQALPGDYIVMVGGRVGADGIHGATFSSEAIDKGSPSTAVQIGDPITQKKFSDALVKEARDQGLYHSITDNGAGGLSSSVAEMAKESGGCLVWLDKVPLKYPGLEPWKIWISESQERMTLAVPKNKWQPLQKLLARRGVEATVIGQFTNSGKCLVKYKNQTVLDLDMEFLHNGLPTKNLKSKPVKHQNPEPPLQHIKNFTETLKSVLGRLNIASSDFVASQYDHEVQAGSALKPLQGAGKVNGDVSVVRPVLNSKKAVILSHGINPTYSDIDTYHTAAAAIDTAIRNAVAAGADLSHFALLDNFCWCSSNEPERLYQLKQAVKACFDYAVAYETPFISGKDSMFNDFTGFDEKGQPIKISVPPTLLITGIGVIEDAIKVVSLDAKFANDLVYILGETFDELGASEYYALLSEQMKRNFTGNKVPKVNALKNKKLYQDLQKCIEADLVASSISVSRGGLATALAKKAIGGRLGISISLENLPGNVQRDDQALFSESQGRILVTVDPKNREEFETMMAGNSFSLIGKITADKTIRIKGLSGKTMVNLEVSEAEKAYKSTFKGY